MSKKLARQPNGGHSEHEHAFCDWSPREEISGMHPQSSTLGVGPSEAGNLMQLRITDFDSTDCT